MNRVVHVITTIYVQDVNVIGITPTDRPRIDEPERVAAILEAPMLVIALANVESVLATKTGGVMVVRNTTMGGTDSVCTRGL